MENLAQILFLASGVKDGEGFWFIGIKNNNENILSDEYLLDCHRKELVGSESSKDILFAINQNLNNLLETLKESNFDLEKPTMGISFNIPLEVLENIFDFWLDVYKEKEAWEICIGLLKVRKKVSLTNLIERGGLKGSTKKWAMQIEKLHEYTPNSVTNKRINRPMWK